MASNNWLDELNPQQYNAVVNYQGPALVIAAAGSGKTRVLTYRIAYALEQGVDAFSIMALTFTNKAAKEMRERIEKLVGHQARNIWMGTFHSVFARILRVEAAKLGYPSNFTVYDTDESKSLIKNIIREMELDDKIYKINLVLGRISGLKNKLISPEAYNADSYFADEDTYANIPLFGKIYSKYKQRCFKAGAMDFDDLLYNTNILFRDHLDVLHKYAHKFKFIFVDEYQDTNISQYNIVRKIASVHQNICVVGDDAQSIYAFRGADIQNILNFEKDYPDRRIFKLEQNYRSTKNIVGAANSVIARNERQIRKEVWTDNAAGTPIDVLRAANEAEEARIIASTIYHEKQSAALKYSDFAVLYRTNMQSRAVEESLRRMNIPYQIIGGLSFYQRKEVKDLLAYLRLVVNPNDEEALRRVINYPKRAIGDTTVNKLIVFADENGIGLWDVLEKAHQLVTGRTAAAIDGFVNLIKGLAVASKTKNAFEVATLAARESGILRELYEDKTTEGVSRFENVQELLNAIQQFVENPNDMSPDTETIDAGIGTFLQQVSLLTSIDQSADTESVEKVTLVTVHGAKGLEYKHVFVAGMEEFLFPSGMMLETKQDLEEERRLFYVAMTRAKQKLTLTHAQQRFKFGRTVPAEPSRFIDEINPSYLRYAQPDAPVNNIPQLGAPSLTSQFVKKGTTPPKPVAKSFTHTPSANFVASNFADMRVGNRVEHVKFGFGTIKQLFNDAGAQKAEVEFDNEGVKTLHLGFAKLMIVGA